LLEVTAKCVTVAVPTVLPPGIKIEAGIEAAEPSEEYR
jgi:hypothetical protein